MQAKQIICRQCGAVIPPGTAACPYCGSAYAPEAEREYMRKLHRIREDLEDVGDAGKYASGKEISRTGKRTAVIVGIILAAGAALFLFFGVLRQRENINNRNEYAWTTNVRSASLPLRMPGTRDMIFMTGIIMSSVLSGRKRSILITVLKPGRPGIFSRKMRRIFYTMSFGSAVSGNGEMSLPKTRRSWRPEQNSIRMIWRIFSISLQRILKHLTPCLQRMEVSRSTRPAVNMLQIILKSYYLIRS